MYQHILAAIDFAPAWDHLPQRLQRLRKWGVTRITLVHVLATSYPGGQAGSHREHYRQRLAGLAGELSEAGFETEWQLREGEVSRELLLAAAQTGAEAVLAGLGEHGPVHDVVLGSTSLELLRLSELPVWLEPAAEIVTEGKRLLLATDGSAAAAGAEAVFRELLEQADQALAVTAISPARAEEERDAAAARLHPFEGVETQVLAGDPIDVISRAAREAPADLIILGKRERSGIAERLFGSTAEAVCRRAHKPVLVVPKH